MLTNPGGGRLLKYFGRGFVQRRCRVGELVGPSQDRSGGGTGILYCPCVSVANGTYTEGAQKT